MITERIAVNREISGENPFPGVRMLLLPTCGDVVPERILFLSLKRSTWHYAKLHVHRASGKTFVQHLQDFVTAFTRFCKVLHTDVCGINNTELNQQY